MKRDPLEAGGWLNRSPRRLVLLALVTAVAFGLLSLSILAFTAYYITCPETPCQKAGSPGPLVLMSALMALIPTIGTGAIGWFIVRGLLADARRITDGDADASGDGRPS